MDEQMRRSAAVDVISSLYPPDSYYDDTARIGKQDIIDALAQEWRSLPTSVLEAIAQRQTARERGV